MGLYGSLEFAEKGRTSADLSVSKPRLKKVAHHGAYGFWCSGNAHRFIIYMLPYNVSYALVDGTVSFAKNSPVSQLSMTFQNINRELVGRSRSVIMPNTMLEIKFTLGDSEMISLGQFYIDRVSASYPDENISISARNNIGKLLKEQTFDENNRFQTADLRTNLEEILLFSGIESYFIANPQKAWKLEFSPDSDLQSGIEQVISLLPGNWQLRENTDGTVGIAPVSDSRFEQPSIYLFERDKTCFSYNVEYSDEATYSKLCVLCKKPEQKLYVKLPPHKWWVSPINKTLYVTVPDGTSGMELETYAAELADMISISGRIESFIGVFTPQLMIGDEIELAELETQSTKIGTVTDIKHQFGRKGFTTSFTVDSSGSRGKPLLKDYVSQIGGKASNKDVVIS